MWDEVCHYVLNNCITDRSYLINVKIEKSPFPIKFVHHLSDEIDISFPLFLINDIRGDDDIQVDHSDITVSAQK